MITKKAGTILLNLKTKQIGLVYRKKINDYSFPKGHLEMNEKLTECAIRETEEETLRKNHLLINHEIYISKYITPSNENVEAYFYIALDDGPTNKNIPIKDQEILKWIDFDKVETTLSYDNLKELWNSFKPQIQKLLTNGGQLTAEILNDLGICTTCYDKQNNYCIYGEPSKTMIYSNNNFECFLVSAPRADGHTVITSKRHYKDMMQIPDDLCSEIFLFAKKMMNILKDVYQSESVYLCTMCDGPMNHFHLQLIPRYADEKRGSKNFVKPRKTYVENTEIINKLREILNT